MTDKFTIALDCDMIRIGPGGSNFRLGRVCIVDIHGRTLLDTYCRPEGGYFDPMTERSGIVEEQLLNAPPLDAVREAVIRVFSYHNQIVGHNLAKDFNILGISLMMYNTCDMFFDNKVREYAEEHHCTRFNLIEMAEKIIGRDVVSNHDTMEDAIASMDIYKKVYTVVT